MPLRISRCFFIVSLLSGSEGLTINLVREVSRGYASRKEGLTKESDYVAVINHSKKFPANRWLLCGDQSSTPVTPVTSSKSHVSHMTWNTLQDTVESLNEQNIELDETVVAGEIHDLLDNVPWESEDYILFDVVVIVPELLSPAISLFGALWRLKKWHNSSLYFLTKDSNSYSSIWIEWSEYLQAEIGSLSTLTRDILTVPIIWRGSLYIQERRDAPSLPHVHLMELSDFKLLLRQSVGGNDDLCINASAHPSHLELVQLIDINQVPWLFLSGVQLQLYIGSSSFPVFHQLFQLTNSQSHSWSSTGVLLRLCYREPTKVIGQSQKKTSDWKNFVLEQETLADSSPLVSGVSIGPLLLVFPRHSSSYTDDTHYDAWLLRQPESLACTSFSDLLQDLQTCSSSSNYGNDLVLKDLSLLNSSQNSLHSSSFVDDHFDANCNTTESDLLCTYSCPELAAITVLEDQLKKKIKRTNTCDLTLGGVVAPPPPTGSLSVPVVSDIIDCFNHNGEPLATSDLVPVAMEDNNGLSIHMIDPETASSVSYKKILSTTPTRARKYHGVNYCLSEEDKLKEAKLLKVQERYIPRERSCHCSTAETPSKELKKIQQRRLLMSNTKDNIKDETIDVKTCEKELEPSVNEEPSTTEKLKNDTTSNDNVNYSSELMAPVPQSSEEVTDTTQSCIAESNKDSRSKDKNKWKKYMETCIVSSLKDCNMNRSHSRFKACYQKCFKISKVYVKDLNASSDMRKQIKRIVQNTVHQVVEFELEQANASL